jgi:hypothetical protein
MVPVVVLSALDQLGTIDLKPILISFGLTEATQHRLEHETAERVEDRAEHHSLRPTDVVVIERRTSTTGCAASGPSS